MGIPARSQSRCARDGRVARALAHADGFGTLELDSAVHLRSRSKSAPILLLEGFFEPEELREIRASDLATVVHNEEQLRMLELERARQPIDVWLKINTGMNRLGFPLAEAPRALERLQESGAARSITLMTHFATAEDPDGVRSRIFFQRVPGGLSSRRIPRAARSSRIPSASLKSRR